LKSIVGLGVVLWRKIVDLYRSDPYTHLYLLYDLLYEWDNCDLVLDYDLGIKSYRLFWRGIRSDAIHLWSSSGCFDFEQLLSQDLLDSLRIDSIIHLHISDQRCIEELIDYLRDKGLVVDKSVFVDMVVDENSFKPYKPEIARRLTMDYLEEFYELKKLQFREYEYHGEFNLEDAKKYLGKYRYYGVFDDDRLVGISCRYLALPEIGVVGDVFVHPDYRGRGYGKILTSAITRDIVGYGAEALLHVFKGNERAIHIYEELGYRRIGEKVWISVEGRKKK